MLFSEPRYPTGEYTGKEGDGELKFLNLSLCLQNESVLPSGRRFVGKVENKYTGHPTHLVTQHSVLARPVFVIMLCRLIFKFSIFEQGDLTFTFYIRPHELRGWFCVCKLLCIVPCTEDTVIYTVEQLLQGSPANLVLWYKTMESKPVGFLLLPNRITSRPAVLRTHTPTAPNKVCIYF